MNVTLITTRSVNDVPVDGYYGEREAWFTREQIGSVLEYDNPADAIFRIHQRHKDRLDRYSRIDKLSSEVQTYNVYMYNLRGVFEICRWSRQPKADMVMDALYEMAEEVMTKGYYSLLSDQDLITLITERQKLNPATLDLIDKTKIKRAITQETRDKRLEETRELWTLRFGKHEQVNVPAELRRIWRDDMPMYHKYLDQFHKDENRERRGQIITI